MSRPHCLGQLNWYNLNMACETILRAYGSMPYLVGSALETSSYRDVDVRLILFDDEFARLFPKQPADPRGRHNDPYWAFVCNCVSEWLRQRTGLPVDFQIQQMTAANETFPSQRRNAVGMFVERG